MSVFRLQGSRVYYVNKEIANLSISFPRDQLLSMGTMIGKFTKASAISSVHMISGANIIADGQVPHQLNGSGSPGATRPVQGTYHNLSISTRHANSISLAQVWIKANGVMVSLIFQLPIGSAVPC